MRSPTRKLLLSGICLVSLVTGWTFLFIFTGTEAEGGRVTGPIGLLFNLGFLVLLVAALLAFFYPRIAGVACLIGSLLCLPLVLYFVMPGIFQRALRGEWRTIGPDFRWESHAIPALVALLIAILIAVRNLGASTFRPVTSSDLSRKPAG